MTTDCHVSISLDGYLAGPDQSLETPLGVGGHRVHAWHMSEDFANEADADASADLQRPRGAYVMGRNMYGPVRGPWESFGRDWRGWWGDEPPYRAPVFVLTHHPHDDVVVGATTFRFVTDGFESAYARALDAADGRDVRVTGGASTVRQAFAAGVLDEITLDVAPVLLGSGERLLDGVADPGLELVSVSSSPLATHLRYRVGR